MNLEEAKKILVNENLHHINWYDEKNLREHQVGIKLNNGKWVVFVTDERASIITGSELKFDSEDEALDVLIQKGRLLKKCRG